jgi:hypothetical protein
MAEASGIPYDVLAWTADWYFREDTLRPASAAVVNHHHRLPMTQLWGTGTLSSSDGQRFPTRQVDHRPRPFPLLRLRGDQQLHPRLRPALHLRHQGDRGH